jgi:hypothetical protein
VSISAGRSIYGEPRSAAGWRLAGLAILIGSVVAGLLVASVPTALGGEILRYGALGMAVILVGTSVSIPFLLANDDAEIVAR